MDDEKLMRDLLQALVEDTSTQIDRLKSALQRGDAEQCVRLAHYARGACANVGANTAASVFMEIERKARESELRSCTASLIALAEAMERLRAKVASL